MKNLPFRNVRIDLPTYELLKKIGDKLSATNGGIYSVPVVIRLLAKKKSEEAEEKNA